MSKIGKKSITIPQGVKVSTADRQFSVAGPKGERVLALHPKIQVEITDKEIKVSVKNCEDRRQKALWGTFRALVQNMVSGVTEGFEKKLEIIGVGYKAVAAGNKLVLNLGYSHPIELSIPAGLEVKVEKNTIAVSGMDKQLVGEFAAHIRSRRPPEPYKGKGVRYQNEAVRRKAGKVVKAVGGA